MRGYIFVCRNQNCNCVFEHKQALCCNVGNGNVWYLSDLYCMWSDREILVMFMSRSGISSSVKTEQCYRCFLSQLDNVYWRKGKHWCFEFLLFFFHVNAFWLMDFCIWVGWFDGVQVNQPHWEFYIWPKPHGWLCKQKLNNRRKLSPVFPLGWKFLIPKLQNQIQNISLGLGISAVLS